MLRATASGIDVTPYTFTPTTHERELSLSASSYLGVHDVLPVKATGTYEPRRKRRRRAGQVPSGGAPTLLIDSDLNAKTRAKTRV